MLTTIFVFNTVVLFSIGVSSIAVINLVFAVLFFYLFVITVRERRAVKALQNLILMEALKAKLYNDQGYKQREQALVCPDCERPKKHCEC